MSGKSNEIIRDLSCKATCTVLTPDSEQKHWCGKCFAKKQPTIMTTVEGIRTRLQRIQGVEGVTVSSGWDEVDFFVRGADDQNSYMARIAIINGQEVLRDEIK